MASVRITGTSATNIHRKEFLGTAVIDPFGHIQHSIDLPLALYQRIEETIAKGAVEGTILCDDGRRIDWFMDRGARSVPSRGEGFAAGEGI